MAPPVVISWARHGHATFERGERIRRLTVGSVAAGQPLTTTSWRALLVERTAWGGR